MARSNRVSIPDGIYHITSRIVNRNHWLADPELKERIVSWLYGIAAFSGIRLIDWCILDNHFHLFIYIPTVPEQYRIIPPTSLDRDISTLPPEPPPTECLTMRPAECNPQRWAPPQPTPTSPWGHSPATSPTSPWGQSPTEDASQRLLDMVKSLTQQGLSPLENISRQVLDVAESLSQSGEVSNNAIMSLPRPPTGFMLSDEEMCERLASLYGDGKRAKSILKSWTEKRRMGNGAAVDAEKDRYCRRMYNVTQFVKTLKERISYEIRKRYGYVGHIFEGRFYSSLVQRENCVRQFVSLYISYNPYKAGLVKEGEFYRWSAFGQACLGGPHGESCRKAFAELFGGTWEEARAVIEACFRQTAIEDPARREAVLAGKAKAPIGQLIKLSLKGISCGAFIGRSVKFGQDVLSHYDKRFPGPSLKSLRWVVSAVEWTTSGLVAS